LAHPIYGRKVARAARVMKIVIVGESSCGKTALLQRLVHDRFQAAQPQTVGIDYYPWRHTTATGRELRIQLWDTSGQRRFRPIMATYLRHATIAVVVYDAQLCITHPPEYWLEQVRQNTTSTLALVAHNCGNADDAIPLAPWSKTLGAPHFTCNARTGEGVRDAFARIVEAHLALHPLPHPVSTIQEQDAITAKKCPPWWCCAS
jgi:small GTP-binding protein